jgi:hypothetical protein
MEGSLVAYKVFTNGSVLNASEINDNLMNQSVMVFSNTAARSAAITSPVEGMVTYLEDSDLVSIYESGAWRTSLNPRGGILQVVEGTTSTNVQTTSTSYVTTGLAATITPKSSSNKVLVIVSQPIALVSSTNIADGGWRVIRGGTTISEHTHSQFAAVGFGSQNLTATSNSIVVFDSPATSSAVTYTVQMAFGQGTRIESQYVNRRSSITLLEVSA